MADRHTSQLEVAIGSFLINYIADARIGAMDEASAARYVSYYWGAAMVGRFIGSFLLKKIEPRIHANVFKVLSLEASVNSRTSFGGTAPARVAEQVEFWKERLK